MVFTLQPVFGKRMIGREDIIKEMMNILVDKRSNTGYSIYGVRRVGKTSILRELELRLSGKKGIVPIYISFWEVLPFNLENLLEEFIVSIMEKYKRHIPLKQKIRDLMHTPLGVLRSLIKNLKLSVKVKENIEILLSYKNQKKVNYTDMFKRAFLLPEELAIATKTKCILLLDELPSILDLKEGISFVRALRTLHEKQKKVAFCISGSIRKTMDATVLSPASPFYKQFLIKEIKPLEKKDVEKILKINFRENRIKIDKKAIDEIYKYTKGVPFYVQFLGKLTIAKNIKSLNLKKAKDVIHAFLVEEGNTIFIDYLHSFSTKEQEILSVIASKELESLTEISKQTGETPNTVATYLLYLIDKGAIEKKAKGKYAFTDNMFKEWLKLRLK